MRKKITAATQEHLRCLNSIPSPPDNRYGFPEWLAGIQSKSRATMMPLPAGEKGDACRSWMTKCVLKNRGCGRFGNWRSRKSGRSAFSPARTSPPCYRRVAGEHEVMGMAIPFRRRRPRDAPTQSARGARRNTPSTASEWGPPGSSAGPPVATRATATRPTRGSITELTGIGRWKQDGGDRGGAPSSRGNIRCERHGEKKQKSCFRR